MLGTFFNFDSNFATTTLSYVGIMLSDLSPYLMLVLGVGLLALIIKILIRIF